MSRISLISRFNNTKDILLDKTNALDKTRKTIASGNKVQNPSDDPTGMVNINRFSNQVESIEQFKENINDGKNNLENSEATISQVSDLLQRVRELTVQANNDTLNEDDRESIANEMDQRLEQVVKLANSEMAQRNLFGGTESTGQDPFKVERNENGEILDVSYQGDFNPRETKTGSDVRVQKNVLGNQLFQATNQGIEGGFEFNYPGEFQKVLGNTVGYASVEGATQEQTMVSNSSNTGTLGNKTSLSVSDASQFDPGQTVRVYKENGSSVPGPDGDQDFEETQVTGVDPTNNNVEVDLKNNYDVSSETVRIENPDTGVTQQVTAGDDSDGSVVNPGGTTTFGGDDTTNVEIDNVDNIEVGDKVRIEGTAGKSERRIVQGVNDTVTPPTIEVDLANNYTGGSATVQKVAEEVQPNGEGNFRIDDQEFFYDASEDSIKDIAQRINERGIQVEAKFAGREKNVDRTNLTTDVKNNPSGDPGFKVEDPSQYEEGQEVILRDDSTESETATITDISSTEIVVDQLDNTFEVGQNATMEKASGEVEEYTPDEVENAQDGPYRFKLESRVPHEIYLKDVDRQANLDGVQGLLSDLQILGDGEGDDPELRSEQNFPNPFSDEATITGKSIFDTMIDTREALQNPDDPDSGLVRKGVANDVGGAAKTRRRFDTPVRETLQESLSDFSESIDNISIERSKIGARLNRLESTENRLSDVEVSSKELLSQFRDADLAEVVTDLRRQEAVQQAALQMASQTLNQSLVNFL